MSISRKFQRSKSKYTLSQKIISAVTAAGFIMQPFTAFAGQIIKQNDLNNNLIKDGVANIWADRVVDKTAVNVFNKFNLSQNEIANMYFGLKDTKHDAANLVNFVNDRIDINGTVNAIQNSQIGGNLFFLSKDGMAVGKSGVINTGSLYVMTPTQDYIDNMKIVAGTADAATAEKELNAITNITKDANAWQVIPVNTSGTITVLGKVNATNEVQMRAAKIGVGKNVSGEDLHDGENDAVGTIKDGVVNSAYIKTGVTKFSNIVNTDGMDISGVVLDIEAPDKATGNIVLSAYVDGATEKNDLEELPVVGATLGPIAETVENTFVEQDFNASVDVYGTVETTGEKGDININATAVNSNADFDEKLNDYKANNNDVAQLANVKAEVNIDGAVKAAEDVTVKAEAINRYIDNSGSVAKGASLAVGSVTPITGDIAYSVLNTEANVNIASEGSIVSDNGNVDIDAKAETLAASAASVTALKFKAAGGTTGANVPAVSVLYTGADNKANVTVEGNINAAENISIDADADMKVDAENKMGIKGKMGNQFVVGVTVAGAENSASVDIKDEDNSNNVINAGNDLSVNANATSDFTSGTSIKAPEASAMAVAVNVTDFNSNANVNIDTDLTAGNDLTVKADNIITDDNVIAESTIGSGKYVSAATQVVTGHVEQKKGEVKEFISGLAAVLGKGKKLPIGDEDEIPGLQLSEIFKAGATVTYSGQKHDSSVTIGKNASLKANEGKLDIGALTKIEDAHITATGTTASYNDAYPAEATLNAAVLVNNMDNSSSVVVADRDEGSADALKGKNGVSVNASTRFEYNRIKNMIQDVKDAAKQIASAVDDLDGSIKKDFKGFINTLNEQIGAWERAFKTADETFATSDSGVLAISKAATAGLQVLTALNNLNTMMDGNEGGQVAADVKATIQGASDILTGALAFADPNSYGNFAAASASKGSSGDTGAIAGHHPSAINGAGTVMVNNVDSVSKVEVGSNSVIASNGKVNLNAENYMKDVSLGGLNTVPLTNSGSGTAASIGATVNYSDFNTDTIVAVNDGANISGGDINIAGSNEIDHVSVAGGAGMGPSDETESKGIVLNGMLSFVDGSSDILTVVDDGAKLTAGNICISGHNDTNIVNVAAGLNLGSGSGAVGVGLAYNDFAVKNIAGVADVAGQIKNLYSYKDDNGNIAVDNSKVDELDGELNNTYTASSDTNTKGSISAYGFNVDAATEGSIQSVSVAASASKNDDTGEVSFFGKIKGGISNVENALLGNGGKLDQVTGKIFGTESGKANDFFNMGSKTHGANGDGIKIEGGTSGKGGFMPSFSIAGSGSVSLNVLDNATEAIVDNAKISMKDKGDISVTARDALYAGAYSGAAALQWKSGGSSSDKAVGFAGAAGVNDIDNVVKAVVKNSTIENAGKFNTMALSGGEQLALGLGLAVEKTGSTSGYSGNAAVSVNLIDHEVEALHENNTVKETEDVNVSAYARDIENTGGGSLGAGQQKVGVGATVGVAMLNNTISAGIKGGEYKYVGNVDVEALNALQNITVGIAAGLTLPSSGSGASAVVEGAGVYNEVHNTTNAFITGTENGNDVDNIVISTVDGGSVNVTAQDVAVVKTYEDILTDGLADGKQEIANRMGKDFDITGKTELDGVKMDDAETELNKNKQDTETKESVKLDKNTGSSIITVAGGLAATTGKGAGGAAVAITDIENTYTADVKYAAITADELDVDAGSNSNIVTVAGGIGAANKGSGVGSVSWNDVDNTAKVNIKHSVVKAQNTEATAENNAQIVSVTGQISGGKDAAIGAALGYVGLDNSTEANISNTTFDKRADEETDGITVKADAQNRSDSYNIGAGVSAAGKAAVNGTVVVTQTHGTAGAVMDKVTINDAKSVTANALDDTDILSVIGTVTISGKAAVGAGVAYTEIGDVSTNPDNGQYVTAEIKNNSTINTDGADSKVDVKAKDEARVINVAVGVGGAANAAVQGASATTLINKTTSAEIADTKIDEKGGTSAKVTVDAQNDSEITSSADVAAAAASGAGVGAGIAVNRIIQQTNAAVNGGTMNVNNLTVNANATPQITNIGVGIGVAGSGAGVTGSVAVNMIKNDVTARIGSGATIVADGTVGVVATSDEQIANYAGQASVAGSGAAVGLSVSYNELTGSTTATIGDATSVSASGKGDALKVKDTVGDENDDKILDDVVDKSTFDSQNTLGDDRVESEYKGVAVSASSTHAIKSFIINGGVAGTGAAVNGTVNVNQIGGSTKAAITGADINTASDVNVIAHDYTNSAGMVGTASIAGTGAGVGLGSDTNTVSREVTAEVSGKDGDNKNTIKAAGFNVEAEAKQGISSLTVSAAGAGIGAGVSNATSVALLNGKTTAKVNNANITASSMNVTANHTGKLNTMGTVLGAGGLGAGVGVGVSVLNENSETAAELKDSNIKIINDEQSSDNNINITAANTTEVNYQLYSVGGALAGVAGAIGVSNVNSKVNTNVTNVAMNGSEADDINIGAENTINFTNTSGSGAGGAVGVGVGVAVNTIDSKVTTTVDDAELNAANDINVTANETRKVKQEAVNAGVGAVAGGANVMITNVGSAVADSYGSGLQTDDNGKVEDGSGINTNTIFDEANKAVAGNKLKDDYTYGVKVNDVPEVTAEKGADNASVVEVKINDATLNAGNKVTAEAVADTNVTMNTVQVSGAAVISATGTVGILDVNRNSVVNINNSIINAKDLAVSTTQKGTSSLDIYQGNVGGAGSIGAAYGSASSTGVNNISVSGSTLNIASNVDINAKDESKTAVNAIGVTLAGGGAASVIVAQGSNNSSTNIDVNDTDIYAVEDIDIHAERQVKDEKGNKVDSLSVSAKAMSGGLMFAGAGVGATANELGKVGVTVADDSNFTAGSDINITALNAPSVSATTGSLSASMVASGAITVAEANIGKHIGPEDKENENKDDNGHLKTFVNIGDGNSFTAKSLTAQAKADAVQNVTMEGMSISAALWPTGSVQANTGGANAYSDVTVTVGENVFKDNGNDENAEGIDLIIKGINNVTQTASAKGISVSTFFASGTNIAQTNSVLNTNVTVGGEANRSNVNDDTKYIDNVDISAESTATINNNVRGDGGGLLDVSPYAAMTDNDINSTTSVNVGGNWDIAGDMDVKALHTDNVTLNTDAVKAAVVGASGVHSDNDITNNTSVTLDDATVTTGGDQNISARNTIDYDSSVTGSGYGVAQGAAVWAEDEITLEAGVNLKESNLTAGGAVDISALTGDAEYKSVGDPTADINKEVTIKSAGVVAGTYAESTDTITFTNNINVGAGSSIATVGDNTADDADITLEAADRTNFTDIVTADTQGGVVGAAWTEMNNTITRNNNITVGGTVDSNYDANFDAGDTSKMNLTLRSNAYNKTAAPLATNPSLNSSMTQNSSINFAAGSSVRSLRNINAAAGAGDTTIAKESKTWRWVDGGETGTGSIASTSDGTLSGGDAVINTTVTVDGSLEAGKNHQLDITIDYADGGKKNMEDAFDEYDDKNLKLSDLGQKLEDAQEAYNKDENVRKLKDAAEKLNKYKEQQENNKIIKGMLQDQIDDLIDEKTVAEGVKGTAEGNLETYIETSCDEYNNSVSLLDRVKEEEFKKALEEGDITKPWYDDYSEDYNDIVDDIKQAEADIAEIQGQIDVKVTEKNGYKDYTQEIKDFEDLISDLKAQTAGLEAAIKAAQENYDEALKSGITEEVVNNAIFNGHIGDDKDTYVNVNASDWYEDQYGSAAEQIGMIDYAASLLKRMGDLIKMSQQYTGTDVGDAYTAELARIQSDLQALGLLTFDSNGIGIAEGASSVPTIELKDLLVSGGNVNISADTLNGAETGSIIAHGDPYVTITNNTDFFLRVNDVTVESDGGKVSHNDVSINPTGENYRYNGIGITAVQGDSANGNNAQITIQNTKQSVANEDNKYDGTLYTPDIGIYGEIYNPFGNIKINNKYHSIYVSGEYTEDGVQKSGNITGRTINLSAGGAVTQGYTDQIYNAAGDPKNALSTYYITAIQNALIEALGTKKDEAGQYYVAFDIGEGDTEEDRVANLAKFLTGLKVNDKELSEDEALQAAKQLTGYVENDKPGIAAGGAIYINAASINVNGTIQSGLESYKLNINSDKKIESKGDILKNLINNYQKPEGEITTDYSKYMTDDYLVTLGESGAAYENGEFVYNIKAWYNPETNEIFTEDIEQAGGGRIYLTGAIANTNASGGKLVVLDGGSDYTIDGSVATEKEYTFKLGSINAGTVDGRIEINDTSSGNTVTTVYTNNIPSKDDKIAGATYHKVDDKGMEYQPTTGLYYNWSNGTSSRVTTSYKHVSDSSWWGLSSSSWESVVGQLDEVTKDQMIDKTFGNNGVEETTGQQLDKGNIITDGSVDGYTQLGTANSGTTAVNGSTAKNDNTLYQIMFERQGERKQGRNDNGDLLYLDANGELTINSEGTIPYYLTDSSGKYIYETEISDRVTTTKKKGLLGLWGKTVTTEWKETSGMITAYNFGLKADNSIGIEFVGNKTSTGTIKSNSDILLGGDIHMGQVEITSTGGSINHVDTATVISDNASFKAYDDIDVIQKNVNEALRLKAESTNGGDINIQAIASNANNMVYIDKVSTTGNVNITAEGSLLTEKGDTVVLTGNGITLQSYGGGIDLVIDGGTEGTNAYAVDNISLTEANGHMYLGEIVAEDGDVVLEVTGDGAGFVDAIVNNSNDNKDSSRLAEWEKLGLLDDGTNDSQLNSKENQLANLESAAESGSMFYADGVTMDKAQEQGNDLLLAGEQFVDLMKGGHDDVQEAREDLNAAQGALNEAIANLGDDPATKTDYKEALAAYNEAYDYYAEVGAKYEQDKANFIENSVFADNEQAVSWLLSYEAIGNAADNNYGWTDKQLLYAVQDTVINPNAGSVSDVKTANVTGNNITFISNTGNLGVVDDQASSLSEIDLKPEDLAGLFTGKIEDTTGFLEKLASARAGDVVWGADDVVIRRTTPVSVKLNSDGGKVTVQNSSGGTPTAEHIYLLAKDSVLNANEFDANDLRLSGQEGLNVNKVTGNSIYLEGGSGDIGHKVNDALQAVQVTLKDNGFISANAAGNVALQQVLEDTGEIVDFTLGSVAGKNVDIDAVGSIVSRKDDISYINASETIDLTSTTGGIGTKDEGLRIKNSGAVVNTDVQDTIYIEAKQDGTLILGIMDQKNGGVNVDSEGTIMLGREDDVNTEDINESVTGSIDAKDDVTLHAENDIIISGKLHVNATSNDGTLQLHSNTGDIIQTTAEKGNNIVAANVGIAAVGGDVELDNPYNIIKKVDLQAVGGSLGLTVSNPDGFNVDMGGFTNKKGGDVSFINSNGSVNITTEDIEKTEEQDPANINGSLTVIAEKGDKATEADINNKGILNATENITFKAADDIYNNIVTANEKIEFTAVDGVINSDTVNGKDVIMQAIEQELENILAKDSVTLNGNRIHGQNITQNTEADGDLIINTDSNSGSGPIESLVIDKIDANDKSVFTELWAVEADITTVDDKMDFNDIMIEENAWLENSGTLATIYGNVPVKDDDANVHIYQSYPSMYVNFIDADTVETDGRLLSLDDYWYAYDQRFTAENHLRWQHGRYLDEDWKQAYGYGLSLHNRYGLIDYQEFTETNAGADEVAVEA